jgi:hypothetical protein
MSRRRSLRPGTAHEARGNRPMNAQACCPIPDIFLLFVLSKKKKFSDLNLSSGQAVTYQRLGPIGMFLSSRLYISRPTATLGCYLQL